MKKIINFSIKLTCIAALIFIGSGDLNAQKLPKIQETGMRLPGSVKIDGKALELGNKFQAYNSSTQVFYTLANDDEKLYLIIQATDLLVARKIMAGSITLTLKPDEEKKNGEGIAITYPIFDRKDWPSINWGNKPVKTKDSATYNKKIDSFVNVVNKQLTDKSKEIKLLGIKGLDTLISVYNETGIKAASLFDHQLVYTYELAVPLKYLGSLAKGLAFNYNIKLNGSNNIEGLVITHIEGGTHMQWYTATRPTDSEVNFMEYPTDLSGTYTLAKQ